MSEPAATLLPPEPAVPERHRDVEVPSVTIPLEAPPHLPDPLARGVPIPERLVRLWHTMSSVVDLRVAFILAFCGGWLVFTQIHFTVGGYEKHVRPLLSSWSPYLKPAFGHLYWFWSGPIVLFAVPLVLAMALLKLRPADVGVGFGHWRSGLKWTFGIYGAFLPLVIAVSFAGPFKSTYPMNKFVGSEAVKFLSGTEGEIWPFLLYEFSYGLYFIGWEFFFRGFMGFVLYRVMGWYGVLVATVPFAVMHVGKPEPEALGSVIAGIALGVFAIKERSFLYGAILHMLVAWTMDWLAIFHKVREAAGK